VAGRLQQTALAFYRIVNCELNTYYERNMEQAGEERGVQIFQA